MRHGRKFKSYGRISEPSHYIVTQEFLPPPFTIRYGRYGILVTALWSKLASFVTYNMKGKMYVFEIEIRIYVLKKISF